MICDLFGLYHKSLYNFLGDWFGSLDSLVWFELGESLFCDPHFGSIHSEYLFGQAIHLFAWHLKICFEAQIDLKAILKMS